jgi:hypothetical protein
LIGANKSLEIVVIAFQEKQATENGTNFELKPAEEQAGGRLA